jgi:hypothetical protein
MADSARDRLILARITGLAHRSFSYSRLSSEAFAALVDELLAITSDPELLAEAGGIAPGFGRSQADSAPYLHQYNLPVSAGADPKRLQYWIAEGERRAAKAEAVPFTGVGPS